MLRLRAVVIFFLAAPITAHAYVDPNVGGWLYQLLLPVLIAIGGAWAVLRQRIKDNLGRLFTKKNKNNQLTEADTVTYGKNNNE